MRKRNLLVTLAVALLAAVSISAPAVHAAKVEDRAAGFAADLLWRITGDLHVIRQHSVLLSYIN